MVQLKKKSNNVEASSAETNPNSFHGVIPTDLKKDWIEQPIVFESNFLKPDRRHFGRTQIMNNSEHVEKYNR